MKPIQTLVFLFAAVMLLTGCQAAGEFLASPMGQTLVNTAVQSTVSELSRELSPDQADAVSKIAGSLAESAVAGVQTGVWQWDVDKILPMGLTALSGALGLNWHRNKQRQARGEPTGNSTPRSS